MSEKSDISAHCFTVQLPTRDLYLTWHMSGHHWPLRTLWWLFLQCCFSSLALSAAGESAALVKVLYFGWKKSLKIIAYAYNFIFSTKHKVHFKNGVMYDKNCKVCETDKSVTILRNSLSCSDLKVWSIGLGLNRMW